MEFLRKKRRIAALAILLAIALVAAFADRRPPDRGIDSISAVPVRPPAPLPATTQSVAAQSVAELPAKLRREPVAVALGSALFGSSDAPPAPMVVPVTVKAAPAGPSVPAFPYRYIGTVSEQGGKVIVFLAQGEAMYSASAGGVVGDAYRIDRIGVDQLELTYLPMKAPLTLRFAEISMQAVKPIAPLSRRVAVPSGVAPDGPAARVDPYSSEPLPEVPTDKSGQ